MRGGGDQELFIEARVIHIVSHGSYQGRHFFQRTQVLTKEGLLDEAGHGLGHIGRMHPIVVGVGPMVVLLYKGRSILVPKIPKIATRCLILVLENRKIEIFRIFCEKSRQNERSSALCSLDVNKV